MLFFFPTNFYMWNQRPTGCITILLTPCITNIIIKHILITQSITPYPAMSIILSKAISSVRDTKRERIDISFTKNAY